MRKLFIKECVDNNLVFTEHDYLAFCQACNCKPEMLGFDAKQYDYVNYKNVFGPCVFHPKSMRLKDVDYNISKIINDLKLNKQNSSPYEKMDKIINYIKLLG